MKTLLALIYGLIFLSKVNATVQCPSSTTIPSSDCSNPQVKTMSDLGIPTGSRQVCIHQNIYMDSACSQSSDIYFFQIQAKYDGTNYQTILGLKWSSSQLVMYSADSTGTATNFIVDSLETQATQNAISYMACVDFINPNAYGGFHTQAYSNSYYRAVSDYANLASLDDAIFYFCHDGTNSAKCDFSNTILSYRETPAYSADNYFWGLNPTLIRSYEANDNSGTTLVDSVNSQDATFSSTDAPSWSQTNYGVEFTAVDQYIKIPTFTPSSADSLVAASFTITMWLRLKSIPTVTSYLFRWSNSDLSQDRYSVTVDNIYGALTVKVGDGPDWDYGATTVNEWAHISMSLSLQADYKTYFYSILMDSSGLNGKSFTPLTTALSFTSNDQILIGGVLATVYKIQVFNPGSPVFLPYDCGTGTAIRTFGLYGNPFYYTCEGSCSTCSGATSSDCLSCSTTSYGIYQDQCQTCPTGTSLIETLCSTCSVNCDTCSIPDTCDDCSSGYATDSNHLCVPVCSANCDACSMPNTCDACSSGYISTSNKLCTPVCSDNCTSCSKPYLCDVCSSGYSLNTAKNCVITTSGDKTEFVSGATSAINSGRTGVDATTQAASIAGNGDPVGVQAKVSGKIFMSIQYFNITYSNDVLTILAETQPTPGKGDPKYVPNIPDSAESGITEKERPYAYEKYHVSSSFVLNFWKSMILVLMIFAALILVLGIEFAAAKRNWNFKYLPLQIFSLLRSVVQNYLLTQLYGYLGDVVMFATLQYRSLQFKSKSEWIDFFVSIISLLVVFSIPTWNFLFILKYRKVKKLSENKNDEQILTQFRESNQGVKLFYDDFSDKFTSQQFFLIFLVTRDLIFSLLLTTMFDHPLAFYSN